MYVAFVMADPTQAQRAKMFPDKKRLKSWRCPHCVSEFTKDHTPRLCMFDSRDKSYVGDHWQCGSVRLMRFIMLRNGVRLIPEERESMITTRWITLRNGDKLVVVWRRGRQRLHTAIVVSPTETHPLRWDEFKELAADFEFDDAEVDRDAWSRGYKTDDGGQE
jgi:hypothetical protein